MAHEEYLRRGLVVASSLNTQACIRQSLERLGGMKKQPKWLIRLLVSALASASKSTQELVSHRDAAPDTPRWPIDIPSQP